MRNFAALLTAVVLAAVAPLAIADEAGLELLPKADGIEMTQYVPNEVATAAEDGNRSDAIFNAHTGGVPAQ